MQQDFTRKIVIVINRELLTWQAMNAATHVAAYLGNKISPLTTGDNFVTKDGKSHPRNSQYPIIILSAKPGQMANLMAKVRASGLLYHGFIREMIETTDDSEIQAILDTKTDAQIEYLAVGIFGEIHQVEGMTKNYSLWK